MASKASSKFMLLEYEGILVHQDAYCVVVSNSKRAQSDVEPLQATQTSQGIGSHPTYHSSLLSALGEVSERLLNRKLKERAQALQFDIDSLKEVIFNHQKEMEVLYKLNRE